MNDFRQDWHGLGDEWRAQASVGLDIGSLTRGIERRRRQMWQMLALEWLLALGALMAAFSAWSRPGTTGEERIFIAIVVVVVMASCGWMLWIRRRLWRNAGLDAGALLALEIERARTSLLYWRVNVWLAMALWLGLYAAAGIRLLVFDADHEARRWMLVLAINLPAVLGSAIFAWWWGRRTQARLLRLRALRGELQDG